MASYLATSYPEIREDPTDSTLHDDTVDSALREDGADYTSLVRTLFESEDWQPLIDHLAEDVVFKATIPDGTPISGEFRGKQAVVDHLARLGDILEFRQERPREFFGNGERVVFLGKESVEIKTSGVTVPESEYATVLDFHDGLITRFLVIQDLTAIVDAYRGD
jgi:ketosteroid isomerase-like protein